MFMHYRAHFPSQKISQTLIVLLMVFDEAHFYAMRLSLIDAMMIATTVVVMKRAPHTPPPKLTQTY